MNKKEVVLDSGVKLLMINTDKFKTVDIGIYFEDNLDSRSITCNTLLSNLLITKTKNYPTRKTFKSYLQDLYDMKIKTYNATYGETFSLAFGVNALNKKYTLNNENLLEKQFMVLQEVLYNPLASENEFENDYFNECKNEYKETLIDLENYKEVVVKKKINEILGKNNKLFEMSNGYLDELETLNNKEVFSKYKQMNENCKLIIVVGEINFDEVVRYANKYLSVQSIRKDKVYCHKNLIEKYDDYSFDSKFNQASIGILFDIDIYFNDELYYPMRLFTEMLNYYLFKIVREEHNFCYSIYANYYGSRGICYLQSNIESKNYEMTMKLINDIIDNLKGNIDEKVMNICKEKLVNGIKKEEDSSIKIIINEVIKDIYSFRENREIIDIIKNISAEHINKVANKIEKKFSVIVKEGN